MGVWTLKLPTNVRHKLSTCDALTDLLQDGTCIVTAMAAAEPQLLFQNLHDMVRKRQNVTLFCANPSQPYPCFSDAALAGHLHANVMFLTASVRKLQGRDLVSYVPQHLSQWTRNLRHRGPIDIFWGSCSLPDERGFVSLGPSCCYESEVLRMAKTVVLEVNPQIPRTYGATLIPIDWVHHFLTNDAPLPGAEPAIPGPTENAIAAIIADLIPDGAVLQLGIGAIPNAIGKALRGKKDLGVHTEMLNDAILELYLSGAITGRRKSQWNGKIIGSFALGSAELYRFLDQNSAIEFHPSSLVNDPIRIAKNERMISINTAIEIDLTGQVCSESIGHVEISGVGGAFETHLGAQRAQEGRGILALPARTHHGVSKIVFELKPGAKVSVSRNDVDTVVTEYGFTQLVGRSVAERVRGLISIAHPDDRAQLTEQARQACYL
jgi:acyl-CoA hydrolase